MTKGLFDVESSSDEGIGSDGEGVEVKVPVLADQRKTKRTRRREAERKSEVKISNLYSPRSYFHENCGLVLNKLIVRQ